MNAQIPSLEAALDQFTSRAEMFGTAPDAAQLDALGRYCHSLSEYNQHTNLVARSDPHTLLMEHALDAWSLVPLLRKHPLLAGGRLVDIGSGAGFPGLIIAIACPGLAVVLVESIKKKARFLETAVAELALSSRVVVCAERAESLGHGQNFRCTFDFATARAVGPIDVVGELALPLLRTGGWLLAQKSAAQQEDEHKRALASLSKLGGKIQEIVQLDAEVLGKGRVVICIEKTATTPDRYPRPAAQISRQPLGSYRKQKDGPG